MEKRIELEKRGRDPSEITELNLDNCRSPNITGLTDEFSNLETLSLMNVGLTSLKGFPKLPNLKKLELSKNRISNGLHVLHSSPKLSELNLSSNKINDLETLEPLKDFKNLKSLDISNNEAANLESYREKIFNLIPQLKYLDGFDVEDHASDDSEADGLNGNGEEASLDGEEDGEDVEDEEADEECADEEDEGEVGDEDIDDEDEDEDGDDIGLEAVYKDNLDEESEGEDYDGEGEGEDEDEDVLDDEEEEGEKEDSIVRGKKRKHEEDYEGE